MIDAPVRTNNSLWHYRMARGWEDVHVVTSLEELLRAIRSGKVEVCTGLSLNGLGRSLSDLKRVIGEFASHKTVLIVPSLGIDTSGGVEVILKMLDCIVEFKRSIAQEPRSALGRRTGAWGQAGPSGQDQCILWGRGPIESAGPHWSRYREGAWHPEFECVQDYWPARRRFDIAFECSELELALGHLCPIGAELAVAPVPDVVSANPWSSATCMVFVK